MTVKLTVNRHDEFREVECSQPLGWLSKQLSGSGALRFIVPLRSQMLQQPRTAPWVWCGGGEARPPADFLSRPGPAASRGSGITAGAAPRLEGWQNPHRSSLVARKLLRSLSLQSRVLAVMVLLTLSAIGAIGTTLCVHRNPPVGEL